MHIVYNPTLKGYQVVWTPNIHINRDKWNKPVNDHIYEDWADAMHYIDRIENMGY